jgi:hypothetical protein
MKKKYIIVLLILALPLSMFLFWLLKKPLELRILVLDKTVLNTEVQEHLSLFWVLKQEKFYTQEKKTYNPQADYFGFFPDDKGDYSIRDLENYTRNQLDSMSDHYDMAFYTDLYGIYRNEWIDAYFQKQPLSERFVSERSEIIYGALTQKDLDFLKMMKQKNKLIINEFNIIASPTSSEIREKYEKEFHVYWTGWTGRYFENLDTAINKEIPLWLIRNYKKDNHGQWPFKNSGIAFVRNDDKIVILENIKQLHKEVPLIQTEPEHAKKYGITEEIKYPFWFDIVSTTEKNNVLSWYHMYPNAHGDSLLKLYHIPSVFPALIQHSGNYTYYYMAGDFSDNPITMRFSYFRYIHLFSRIFYTKTEIERKSFFWKYYRPLITTILNEYHEKMKYNE